MLIVKPNILTLKGITLRGSIQLYNPNQNLAVIFQIETPLNLQICVQPKRGIVMQQQIKLIRVGVKDQERQKFLLYDLDGKFLKVNSTMKTQYNRKMFEKLNLNGWERAKESFETIRIQIVVSNQAKNIRSDIRYQTSNSLNKISNSRESGSLKRRQQFKVGQSYSYGRETNDNNRKKINDQLDRQLDFIFENQGSKKMDYLHQNERRQLNNYIKIIEPNTNYKDNIVEYDIQNYNRQNKKQTQEGKDYNHNKNIQSQRFLQIIMLAALAGFFAALGSNFKHLFK